MRGERTCGGVAQPSLRVGQQRPQRAYQCVRQARVAASGCCRHRAAQRQCQHALRRDTAHRVVGVGDRRQQAPRGLEPDQCLSCGEAEGGIAVLERSS